MKQEDFMNNYSIFEGNNHKVGLKSKITGTIILPAAYSEIRAIQPFYSDNTVKFLKLKRDNKFWLCDLNGNTITSKFDYLGDYSYGIAPFCKNGLWGFLNSNGYMLMFPSYSAIEKIEVGKFKVKWNDKWGIVTKLGMVVQPIYDSIWIGYDKIYGKLGMNEIVLEI